MKLTAQRLAAASAVASAAAASLLEASHRLAASAGQRLRPQLDLRPWSARLAAIQRNIAQRRLPAAVQEAAVRAVQLHDQLQQLQARREAVRAQRNAFSRQIKVSA